MAVEPQRSNIQKDLDELQVGRRYKDRQKILMFIATLLAFGLIYKLGGG